MKTTLEKKLEYQELSRLVDYDIKRYDSDYRIKVLSEIERIHKMRDTLESHRLESKNSWVKTLVQTSLPVLATVALAIVGYASEHDIGNPTGFTLKWLIGRTPK